MLSFFVKKKKMSSIIKKMNRTTNEIKICDSIKKIINSFHLLSDIDEIKMLDTGMCVKSVVYAQFLFNIYNKIRKYIPHPLLSIYYTNHLTSKSHCTGIISIIQHVDKSISIRTKNDAFYIEKTNVWGNKSYTTEFQQFAEEWKSRIRKSSCTMTTLMYNIIDCTYTPHRGHSNLIFAFKNENRIELVVYDPHGKENPMFYDQSNYLVQSLENVDSTTFRNKGRHIISCPRGLQTYGKDKTGLCHLYSLFFLSCVLQVSKEVDIVSNLDQFYLIEQCIIKSIQPAELEKIVVKFSLQLFSDHYETCSKKIKSFHEIFNEMAVEIYNKQLKDTDKLQECNESEKVIKKKRKKPYTR